MTDSSIPCLSYTDFAASLDQKTGGKRLAYTGTIEVTPYCNLKCVHCYINNCHWEGHILSYLELCRILDQLVEEGCLWLLFTGGEPFVRDDFLDVYTYAKKKGIIVTLFTNATLITPTIADYLHEWPPRVVEVTLYGATRQTYERVTGIPGSYERCIEGIELLVERHIPIRLKTMLLTINKNEIWQMKDYAEKLGVPFRYDPAIIPCLDGGLEPYRLRLTPEEVVEIEMADSERLKSWREFCQTHSGPVSTDSLYICNAGTNSFFIDSFGRLSLCLMARYPSYDLRQGSFTQAWHDFLPQVKSQKARADSKCRSCELVALCGRCAAWAELETGNPESEVEWLCRLAHLRQSAFGIGVPVRIK